ncbi:hypothetical protein C2S51_035891 [Perilla frutescens var. frutescens]|nr:hypothetical protein C2S51_035891 [Perilla frutescens var. frutescens]
MAGNKFASMLQKNCHKIIVILVYAVLEWILILLLLLNSLFSYLIAKFAKFFGLKQSCTWCSRLDHVFNSKSMARNPHFDHVCEAHGAEISKMSYCSTHNKLAESKNLCIHCSSSRPADYGRTNDVSSTVAFFTWMSESASEEGEVDRCSCCDQILNRKVHPHSLIFKPSWDVLLECLQKNKIEFEEDLMKKMSKLQENGRDDDDDDQKASEKDDGGRKKTTEIVEESLCDSNLEVQEWSSSQTTDDPFWNLGCNEDHDESVYIADMLLQNAELMDSDRFICIELIDTDAEREMPLTNSSEDVDEGRDGEQGLLPVEETSDVDTAERSLSSEEHEKRGEGIHNLATPSREIDGVEEPEKFSEYQQKDFNNCVEAVGGATLPCSSETESSNRDNEARSGFEGGVESLKTRIEAQERALNAVYAELEEERKAAAEAAKETMAMITKIQEEKAAMQMEALQYQRMMEEQAEYDQEALQLLNDLMLKREKEKKQLEKELEIYRCKAMEDEARRRKGGGSSSSLISSNASSNNSIDLHCQDNLDDSLEEMEETGVECITNFINVPDISLAEFDEERLSILEELKVLEAKLFTLHDIDDDDEAKQKLLPLFDAAENEDHDKEEISNQSEGMINSKILIHEELGHVYERLQALEADKDFLNHCIRSMMKGNQGMPLLQEILQHLRDLKSVELSARNLDDIPFSDPSMAEEDHQEQD